VAFVSAFLPRAGLRRAISSLYNARMRLGFALLSKMKTRSSSEYYETDIVCACGAVYTRSTRRDIKIGICAACLRFSPANRGIDTAGRVKIRPPLQEHEAVRVGKTA
jgi:hypothetical protein